MHDATHILANHWGIHSSLRAEASGGSRTTWQINGQINGQIKRQLAGGDWLSRCHSSQTESLQREVRLLELINERLAYSNSRLRAPETIPSLSGKTIIQEGGFLYRITRNIPGIQLKATDRRTYPVLIEALNSLHLVLNEIPRESSTLRKGVVENLEQILHFKTEHQELVEVLQWLRSKMSHLKKFSLTVTHGDFNPTNIIYHEIQGHLEVAGILDFELSRPDPAIMDYSQLFSMIICHSGSTDLKADTDQIVAQLGDRFKHEELCATMTAYWVDLYFQWRDQNAIAEERIRMRLGQIWKFIQTLK